MPAKKEISATNTGAKKPRGKPFPKGNDAGKATQFKADDPRANRSGQRNKAAVQTATQYRDTLVEIVNKPFNSAPPPEPTYLEWMAYKHVAAAAGGDGSAREQLLDRIWGKAATPVEMSGKDGGALEIILREITQSETDATN